MLDNLEKLLQKASLKPSEITVYKETVKLGQISSSKAVEITGLPKSTVMAALSRLEEVGLCKTAPKDKRSLTYQMQEPSAIQPFLGSKAKDLNFLMDSLAQINLNNNDEIKTSSGKGQVALEKVLEEALRCKSRKWQIVAPRSNALTHLRKDYISYFKKVRNDRGITSQTLWESGSAGQYLALKEIIMRKPRYVPSSLAKNIPGTLIVFDDKILFIEGKDYPAFVSIQSQALASLIGLFFEMSWRNAKEG